MKKIALDNGFKLKAQPNGEIALNPYVFDFAHALRRDLESQVQAYRESIGNALAAIDEDVEGSTLKAATLLINALEQTQPGDTLQEQLK